MVETFRLATISLDDVKDLPWFVRSAWIDDVEYLSSYNWIEGSTPIIAVPGYPSRWAPPDFPLQLQQDSGFVYVDQNAARNPTSPLEPLFRAVYHTNPSFDIRSVGVVSDRNNIRKLFSFVDAESSQTKLEPFKIRVELVGNTLLFGREEPATHQEIGPNQFTGYGHTFEKACTTSQISGSTGHYRIITYWLGGLKFVIRHELDGYLDTDTSALSSKEEEPASDDLPEMLEALAVSSTHNTPDTAMTGTGLTIKDGGRTVPLESTIEIKTRSITKRLSLQKVLPQMWVSQTPKLVRARHQGGTFLEPRLDDVTAEVQNWEYTKQEELVDFVSLIMEIVDIMKEHKGAVVLKYDPVWGVLKIDMAEGPKMLPEDLYSKWDRNTGSNTESSTDRDTGAGSQDTQRVAENDGEAGSLTGTGMREEGSNV